MDKNTDCGSDYEWFGASLPEPENHDSANADCFGSARRLAEPQGFLGIVCDGVSASSHGKSAARIACEKVVSSFLDDWTGQEVEPWLDSALRAAHGAVREQYPRGEALCTVVAALVIPSERRFTVAHAGDSGAYQLHKGECTKRTLDHSVTLPVRVGGRVVLQDGVPVMAHAVILTIGQNGEFQPEIHTHDYEEGDWLCLASDGVLEPWLAPFFKRAGRLLNERKVEEFCARMREASQDDTTLLVLRLGETDFMRKVKTRFNAYGDLGPVERDALLAELGDDVVLDSAELGICLHHEENEERAIRIVDLMTRDLSGLDRTGWIRCLDTVIQRGQRSLANRLIAVIRRL